MRCALLAGVAACLATPIASAQTQASLGAGVSSVRSPTGNSSSPSLTPAAQFGSASVFAGVSGAIAALGQGEWSTQGRASLWLATPPLAGQLRLAADGNVQGTSRTGGVWTAAAHGLGELLWAAPSWGVGVAAGSSSGWIEGQPSVHVLHTRGRAWFRTGSVTWITSAEPTRFLGAWFTDATAGLTFDRGRVVASAWGQARLSSTYDSRVTGSAFLQYFVTPNLAIELGGGGYLPDPYQGLSRGHYVSAGLRIHAARRVFTPAEPLARPLVPVRQGDSLLVRFHLPGASAVALAGDWNDWQPVALTRAAGDDWEGVLTLKPGVYHFVLQVDGKDWVVPSGVASVPDGMGGMTAMLLVQP